MDDFKQIFRTYSPVVHRFLLSLCGDVDLAQELTAETFYQAYLHIGKVPGRLQSGDLAVSDRQARPVQGAKAPKAAGSPGGAGEYRTGGALFRGGAQPGAGPCTPPTAPHPAEPYREVFHAAGIR